MEKFIPVLILLASIINSVVCKSGTITSYVYSINDNKQDEVLFLCDKSKMHSSCRYSELYIYCSGQNHLHKSSMQKMSFDCSFLKLNFSENFQNFDELLILSLSNVDLKILKKEDFEVFTTITEIDLSHNYLTKIPSNIFARNRDLWEFFIQSNQ